MNNKLAKLRKFLKTLSGDRDVNVVTLTENGENDFVEALIGFNCSIDKERFNMFVHDKLGNIVIDISHCNKDIVTMNKHVTSIVTNIQANKSWKKKYETYKNGAKNIIYYGS